MSSAPNYRGQWPGAAPKLGPTWQAIWDHMDDGRWYRGPDLQRVFSKDVTPSTVATILREATKANVLIAKTSRGSYGRTSFKEYRRSDVKVETDGIG